MSYLDYNNYFGKGGVHSWLLALGFWLLASQTLNRTMWDIALLLAKCSYFLMSVSFMLLIAT